MRVREDTEEQSWRFSDRQGLQVKTVQEVCGKHAKRGLRNEWSRCRVIITPHSPHGEVQLMLLLRFHTGGIPGGWGKLHDAGSAHLTVQVIDQAQQPVRLRPQESLPGGAFEEVLHAAAGTLLLFFGINPSVVFA